MRDGAWILWVPALIVAALIGLGIWEEGRWTRYRDAHHCAPVATHTEWMYIPQGCGKGCTYTQMIPYDRVTFRCDGGETVVR